MNRQSLLIILTIAMMAVAGCSGGPFASDSITTTTSTDSGAKTVQTTTTAQSEPKTQTRIRTQSKPKEIERPPGWNESGVADRLKAYNQHYSALYSYDSFTRTERWTYLEPGQTLTIVGKFNQSAKRLHRNITVTESGTQILHEEEYQEDSTLYVSNRFDPPTYNSTNRYSFDTYMKFRTNRRLAKSGPVQYMFNDVRYNGSERVTRDGKTLFRYYSSELLEQGKIDMIPSAVSETTVNNFTMTTLVDSDGFIRTSEYEITYTTGKGETYTRTGMIRFNGTNVTTVTEPGWVEAARQS